MLTFKNKPDTSTPINADNLNANFEELNQKTQNGSNSNGSYLKFADGTMICFGKTSVTNNNLALGGNNGIFRSSGIAFNDFPVPFVEKPDVFFTIKEQSSNMIGYPKWVATGYYNTDLPSILNPGRCFIIFWGADPDNTQIDATVSYTAIGKWK